MAGRTPISATPATVQELLNQIPFQPTGANATGMLTCIVRSMGHILYLVGMLAEDGYTMSDEEQQNELDHAASHLDASIVAASNTLSTTTKQMVTAYISAVEHCKASALSWGTDDKKRTLRDLANRAAGLAAVLDRECIGIASNPGSSL